MGNTPNTDILCSNSEGTKFVHIQVKTYVPGNKTVTVGVKAEPIMGTGMAMAAPTTAPAAASSRVVADEWWRGLSPTLVGSD